MQFILRSRFDADNKWAHWPLLYLIIIKQQWQKSITKLTLNRRARKMMPQYNAMFPLCGELSSYKNELDKLGIKSIPFQYSCLPLLGSGKVDLRIELHQCLFISTWIGTVWLPCLLSRGQQVTHQRWIWGWSWQIMQVKGSILVLKQEGKRHQKPKWGITCPTERPDVLQFLKRNPWNYRCFWCWFNESSYLWARSLHFIL